MFNLRIDPNSPVSTLIEVPVWIDPDIDLYAVQSVRQGGCASGAYMPAVTYYDAASTMAKYGEQVTSFLADYWGEPIEFNPAEGWDGFAVRVVSLAVELWAAAVLNTLDGANIEFGAES